MFYSIIIPVYNRPDEMDELLASLELQTYKAFEVIVVEDGSSVSSEPLVSKYQKTLSLKYFCKPNSGPGLSRNYGAERSKGDYLIFVDSDCILPEQYLEEIEKELKMQPVDLFGGADKADNSFSNIQKAINYSMTSFLTTGGIRGGRKRLDNFYPRSFNLGVSREAFEAIGGFSSMRFGEDIDFSIRILKKGYTSRFFPNAWVYHKRRTNLKKFFKQVYNSGMARINLYRKFPETLKVVHLLPAMFIIGLVCLFIFSFFNVYALLPIAVFIFFILMDALVKTKSLYIGILSVAASFIQLLGYGSGFLFALGQQLILKRNYVAAFEKNFYD